MSDALTRRFKAADFTGAEAYALAVIEEHRAALAAFEQLLHEAETVCRIEATGVLPDFQPLNDAVSAVRASDESPSQRPSAGREGE